MKTIKGFEGEDMGCVMNKEIIDALHMLLHCSLKDTEYETQKEQFKAIHDYICSLEQENQNLKERVAYLRIQVSAREKVANEYKETLDKAIKHVETLLNHNTGMNCGDMQDFLYFLRGDD